MSKMFQSNNKLFSRPYKIKNIKNSNSNNINDNNNNIIKENINSSVQDIINLYTNSNNNNNITIDYPRHYSPSYRNPFKLNYINFFFINLFYC